MIIQINITILIQIINFLIAYGLLRCIILRPAVVLIEAEAKKRADLRELIAYNYVLIIREKDILQEQWQEGFLFYEQQAPVFRDPEQLLCKGIYPEQEYPYVSDEMATLLINNTTQELIKKVKTL